MMKDGYRIVSGIVTKEEFDAIERARALLNIPRSELVRRALVQFLAVHEFKLFLASLPREEIGKIFGDMRNYIDAYFPEREGVITHAGARSEQEESSTSSFKPAGGGE